LGENAIQALVECGLRDRFPAECHIRVQRIEEVRKKLAAEIEKKKAAIMARLDDESAQLKKILREAIVKEVMSIFPCVIFVASIIADRLTPYSSTLCRKHLGCLDESGDQELGMLAGAKINHVL
jgi:hypothetical protein